MRSAGGVAREGRIPGLKRSEEWGVTPGLGEPERPEGSGGQSPEGEAFSTSGLFGLRSALELVGKHPHPQPQPQPTDGDCCLC